MQIFSRIGLELTLLREALLMGAGMLAVYDVLRVLRRIFPHGILWISLEDAAFSVVSAGWFFLRIGKANDGIIRFYIILGAALGAFLYYRLLSRHLMKFISRLIRRAKKALQKVKKAATIRFSRKKHKGTREGGEEA